MLAAMRLRFWELLTELGLEDFKTLELGEIMVAELDCIAGVAEYWMIAHGGIDPAPSLETQGQTDRCTYAATHSLKIAAGAIPKKIYSTNLQFAF